MNTGLEVPTTSVMPMLIPKNPRTVTVPFVNHDLPPVSAPAQSPELSKVPADVIIPESTVSAVPTWVTP